jgi:hypothetical protein
MAVFFAVNHAIRVYAEFETRFPESLDELLGSDYLPVSQDELVNPYSDGPVTQVPWREQTSIDGHLSRIRVSDGKDLLGNLSFMKAPDGGLKLSIYVDPEDGSDQIQSPIGGFSKKSFDRHVLGIGVGADIFRAERERRRRLYMEKDRETKRLLMACEYIGSLMTSLPRFGFPVSKSWEQLQATGFVLPVRNPYTGAPIRDVSFSAPTPGDFTYAGVFSSNSPTNFQIALPICYDRNLESVDPTTKDHLRYYQDREDRGGILDRDGLPVKSIVLIH